MDPGAAILARAVLAWRRHCRRSKATAAPGERPPLPVSIERIRYAQARPPTAGRAGIAAGARPAAACGYEPAAPECHMASQAAYGAVAAWAADRPAIAMAASQTASIGRQQSAARYSRPGGQPASQAAAALPAAARETGAATTLSPAARASRPPRPAARA